MKYTITILLACLMLPVLLARADGDKTEPLAIVVKRGSKLSALTSAELLKIYKGEQKTADDGTRFVLTMRSTGSSERAAFLDQVMHMSESEYQKYFLQAVFTGKVKEAPKSVSGGDALSTLIDGSDGAIGYVRMSEISRSFNVVSIDGKMPGDAGYPINTK